MSWNPLSEANVDKIVDSPKKVVGSVSWISKENLNFVTAELSIKNEFKVDLKVIITLNCEDHSKYSCVLLLNNKRVRGLCVKGNHKNKCIDRNKWVRQTHKHKWTDKCREGWAYTPNDIDESSVEKAFYGFLKECNIEHSGMFEKLPPIRKELG